MLKDKLNDLKIYKIIIYIKHKNIINKNGKKCIKKLPKFTKEQFYFIKIRFNKYQYTNEQLIYHYFIEFGVKFNACVKTLYKWIYLEKLGLRKETLPHRGKKYKKKLKQDNRGKLINFKSIWDIENKFSSIGWFEMDTVVGKNHQSSCLVLVEQSSKNYFVMKLKKQHR